MLRTDAIDAVLPVPDQIETPAAPHALDVARTIRAAAVIVVRAVHVVAENRVNATGPNKPELTANLCQP